MPESVPVLIIRELERIQNGFELSKQNAKDIETQLKAAFSAGYAKHGEKVGMLPTYVTKLPDGREQGEAWAIDLGGTNLYIDSEYSNDSYADTPFRRVCKVVLKGNHQATLEARKFPVSEELKQEHSDNGFRFIGYIVDCLDKFMTDLKHPRSTVLPLGFTFSFPVTMEKIDSGKLIKWTKGYDVKGTVDQDVAKLLNTALTDRNLPIRCNALLNDTVGALVSHTYHTGSCSVGAIFGTGTNAALVGKISKIAKLQKPNETGSIVVNTEWGGFDESSVITLTSFDRQVDEHSGNKGFQLFEKVISGKYLGEITRYILLDLIKKDMLFSGYVSSKLDKRHGFDTRFMSDIEMDTSGKMDKIRKIVTDELGLNMAEGKQVEHSDLEIVRWACQCVGIRAALLSGIAVAAALKFIEPPSPASVGIDGTVFLHYPNFKNRLRESLEALELDKDKVKIGIAEDGSGIGAGICAFLEARGAPQNDGGRDNVH
ncbi:unnamed protein product [Rhizoctonia solani]|uniref:Phosphotransferase n=1 Tax=Rhizoctonia solani TaxID=456999 RepID=A0A8H3CE88_9AGAM|nr:unnamed protein product [Rhizoctonia solani]